MKSKSKISMMTMMLITSVLIIPLIAAAPDSIPLVADGGEYYDAEARYGIVIGSVDVTNNASHLVVTYTITVDDWYLNETHLAVGDNSGDLPQTKKGNPRPGKFSRNDDHLPGVKTFTYEIPLGEISHDGTITIATHAAVTNLDEIVYTDPETGEVYFREESAWGEGSSFVGGNWAMYFDYSVQ